MIGGEMATVEDIEEHAEERRLTLTEALEKYDVVSVNHDPVNGSYVIMADRTPLMNNDFSMRELGYASPSPFTSWVREERVPELMGKLGLRTYYDMKRADGTVRGALRLLKTPIMAARWFVEPESDTALDKNVASFVEKNLFEELSVPWSRIVEDALLMCEFGFMPFELVFTEDAGKLKLQKIAPRHPLDIMEWIWDGNGGIRGIIMEPSLFMDYGFQGAIEPTIDQRYPIFIPIEKMVIFTLEQEAGDLRGISILRSAYKHYYFKDCKSEDTEILTKRGWLTHDKLVDGDIALTLNPKTEMSEWNDIEYVRRYKGVHDAIEMESQQISSISTPDHRWPTKDATWKSPYKFVTTENLRQRHIIPTAALCSDIPTEPKYNDDLVELVGWFITEGSWQGYSSTIAQNYDQPFFHRIQACLTGLFGHPYKPDKMNIGFKLSPGWYEHTKKHDPNGCQFKINSAATKTIREFVKGKNKVVTNDFIFSLTKAQLELFVETCLRGDGSGPNEIRQNDKERLEPIALACLLLGCGVNFHSWKHTDENYPDTIVYQLLISRKRIGAKPLQSKARYGSRVERITYEGIVWCPKTKNGTWLARRNGKVYYTGNTLYKIDAIQKERHGIGIPIIKLPPGFSTPDRKLADELGRNLRTNERAHIVVPNNWDIAFAKLEGHMVDCLPSIQHHDMKIKSNILAPFMDEPNVKPDSLDVYFKSTRYVANTLCDTINHFVIPKLVNANFSRGGMPKLRVRRIGEWEDIRTMSFAFRNFVGAGSITPDDPLEAFFRRELDLPPMDPKTARTIPTPQLEVGKGSQEQLKGSFRATQAQQSGAAGKFDGKAPPTVPVAGPPRQSTSAPTGVGKSNTGKDNSGGKK